jgi:hypothetical protein
MEFILRGLIIRQTIVKVHTPRSHERYNSDFFMCKLCFMDIDTAEKSGLLHT